MSRMWFDGDFVSEYWAFLSVIRGLCHRRRCLDRLLCAVKGRPLSEEGLDADCIKEVGKEPPLPPADESYFHGLYALLQESATCLRSKGFRVSEAPSEDVWVETYSGTSWYPWLEIMNTGGDADAALRACPQPQPMDIERKGKEWAATKG
ncbi:hypothetical protein ACXA45_04335 [Neomicrococcus lactis]